jgi:uncharacterized membrane protein
MSSADVQVFVATFPIEDQAAEVLAGYRQMDKDGTIKLVDAIAVVRGADGTVSFVESPDPSPKKWATRGAVAGGVVGLIFPPSILVSAAIGAAGGGIWGKIRDKGFDDDQLKRVGESLPPGGSAVVVIAEENVIEQLQQSVTGYHTVARLPVSADAAAVISPVDHDQPDANGAT